MKAFTFGYGNKGFEHSIIKQACIVNNAVLIDARYKAYTGSYYTHDTLKKALGAHYHWVKSLGNVNYNNGKQIEIYQHEDGIAYVKGILESGTNIILMCACRGYELCHRRVVVEMLQGAIPQLEYCGELVASDYVVGIPEQLRLF